MQVIDQREPAIAKAQKVAWLSDLTRPVALVLVQFDNSNDTPLGPFGHIGVACGSRGERQKWRLHGVKVYCDAMRSNLVHQ